LRSIYLNAFRDAYYEALLDHSGFPAFEPTTEEEKATALGHADGRAAVQAARAGWERNLGSLTDWSTTGTVSVRAAASRAAQLANDECWRRFKRRPFKASQHPALLENGEYRWGGLDPAGPGGFSAFVTFRTDGSEPKVEVYFSTDLNLN
jgi:hypothetical protein